ncbi:GNAT family N-acetyltransferase [Streptomyces sp. NPDC051784]|uniref:GNAT family N-acetyltransferase n=1 Tax=Streptomyces sp. NPDC051784 TaxID=3155805 RepID=UPI00342C90E2
MIIRLAERTDRSGLLALASEVEHWFGPMVKEPGFHRAVDEHIRDRRALVAVSAGGEVAGGLLLGVEGAVLHIHWLVVSERIRGTGAGRALMGEAMSGFGSGADPVEVVTFGADHPGAVASGARVFYERLGFTPAEAAEPGPEGGSRQVFRLRTPAGGAS